MTIRDLMPAVNGNGTHKARNGQTAKYSRTFATANAAVQSLKEKFGPRATTWTYHDLQGEPSCEVVRWNNPDGTKREIRPVTRIGSGWNIRAMASPRPLYHLPELANASLVLVTEGEKAAEAARGLGFTVTTSAGGSQAADKTDWTPLAGKEVWILPDNDKPGQEYLCSVAQILTGLNPPAVVKEIKLPDLPEGGDIYDWLATRGDAAEPDDLRQQVEAMGANPLPAHRASDP